VEEAAMRWLGIGMLSGAIAGVGLAVWHCLLSPATAKYEPAWEEGFVLWFLGCAALWAVFGSVFGAVLGIVIGWLNAVFTRRQDTSLP
jgi:hypothetical protein